MLLGARMCRGSAGGAVWFTALTEYHRLGEGLPAFTVVLVGFVCSGICVRKTLDYVLISGVE